MSTQFDPYYTWLGISPEEQPAHYYRLLGVRPFEPNAEVISNASDRQLAHVRTYQSGPRSADSQRLLNEITAATHCLLDPHRKATYDADLRARMMPSPVAILPQAALISPELAPASHRLMPAIRETSGRSDTPAKILGMIFLGVAGIVVAVGIWLIVSQRRDLAEFVPTTPAPSQTSNPIQPPNPLPRLSLGPEPAPGPPPPAQKADSPEASITPDENTEDSAASPDKLAVAPPSPMGTGSSLAPTPAPMPPSSERRPTDSTPTPPLPEKVQPPSVPAVETEKPVTVFGKEVLPGLLVYTFDRLSQQQSIKDSDRNLFVDPARLGSPLSPPSITLNVNGWRYDPQKNAVAAGYLKVDRSGEYQFHTYGYFDRNVLYINGKLVCPYGTNPDNAPKERIVLRKGLVQIALVGYVEGKGQVTEVKWKPPGERGLVPVPTELLFHDGGELERFSEKRIVPANP